MAMNTRSDTPERVADLAAWCEREARAGRPAPTIEEVQDRYAFMHGEQATRLFMAAAERGLILIDAANHTGRIVSSPDGSWTTAPRRRGRLARIRTQRKCLRCCNLFMSTGPANQICCSCKNSEDWRSPGPTDFSVVGATVHT
jgi:hypothetical protein